MVALPTATIISMSRCFEQRDLLTLLLAAPGRVCHDDAEDEYRNNPIRRLDACLNDGNVAQYPAYELKSIFSALLAEEQANKYDPSAEAEVSIDRPLPKRARRQPPTNNNLHSILRFVERVIDQRYHQKPKCTIGEDEEFLEDALKSHFGSKDVSFQAEEDILCLAFDIAVYALMQSVKDDNSSDGNDRGTSDTCNVGKLSEASTGIIRTALQIIDCVVLIDRRERAERDLLQQTKKKKDNQYSTKSAANVADRRMKYEHLLQPKKKRRSNVGTQGMHSENSTEMTKSIMEEKSSKQWEWLCQFRRESESKSTGTSDLQQSHFPKPPENAGEMDEDPPKSTSPLAVHEKEKRPESNFVIVRRKIETLDDISLPSSDDSEVDTNEELGSSNPNDKRNSDNSDVADDAQINNTSIQPESKLASTVSTAPTLPLANTVSPHDKLDQETHELRLTLLDMPPSESSSAEVVRHTVEEIASLLSRYGELDGATGISRCGDVLAGNRDIDASAVKEGASVHFPLNDVMVSALVKVFLTDATGAVRAKAFLRSFVLPLMIDMNPIARAVTLGSHIGDQNVTKDSGKPASRLLTSLLTTLARDRPTECVVSVIVPSLVLTKHIPSISSESEALVEPTRFQCELISRVLRGKDALSLPAITLLVEELLPTIGEAASTTDSRGGMKWTENTMPVLSACLNRQPSLHDDAVAKLADKISYHLSPKSSTETQSMAKSMKFSTLFHAFVTKYGSQVKSTGRVESLKDSATRLKTFMSKTIVLSLKKLS